MLELRSEGRTQVILGDDGVSARQVEGAACAKARRQAGFQFWPCHSMNSSNSSWSFLLKDHVEGAFPFFSRLKKVWNEGDHL